MNIDGNILACVRQNDVSVIGAELLLLRVFKHVNSMVMRRNTMLA